MLIGILTVVITSLFFTLTMGIVIRNIACKNVGVLQQCSVGIILFTVLNNKSLLTVFHTQLCRVDTFLMMFLK